jgi:aminoglycoside phosphotransferase (APT) family kinase protein
VNTVSLDESVVEKTLRTVWPAVEVKDMRPLTGGQWATMAHLQLNGQPDGVPDDVVLRVAPDAAMGTKELAVQAEASDAGIVTPRVHLTGNAGGGLVGAWSLMDLAPGEPLIADLAGAAGIRRLSSLLRHLPRLLADTMATVHGIDPRPVTERVRVVAPAVALTVDELWAHLHAAADRFDDDALTRALERLHQTRPPQDGGVLCHGDLHPLNLLIDHDTVTVLDWTGAVVAPGAYDVGFTWLLLRHPPLVAPALLRPAIRAGAAVLARRFVQRYRYAAPATDLSHIDWYAGLHAARVLIDLAGWQHTGDPRAEHHPWRLVAPGASRALERASGVRVAPPCGGADTTVTSGDDAGARPLPPRTARARRVRAPAAKAIATTPGAVAPRTRSGPPEPEGSPTRSC